MVDPHEKASGVPLRRSEVVDLYFMEHRARLLDVAAFLDRIDRAGAGDDDFRMQAFRRALGVLQDGQPERARRILELLSDPGSEPIAKAGMKGATGAHDASAAPKGGA
jgi:hypothetical protein